MAGLLRDRYYEYAPDRLLDLLTGEALDRVPDARRSQGTTEAARSLIELLEHGREGFPRWIAIDANGHALRRCSQSAAEAASRCGYVPISVAVYLRARPLLADELSTRALMLVATPATHADAAHAALMHAAAASSRPHVLITIGSEGCANAGEQRHGIARASPGWTMREARAAYGRGPAPARAHAVPADVAQLIARAQKATEFVKAGRHAAAVRLLRETAAALVRRDAARAAALMFVRLGRLLLERGNPAGADAAFADSAAQAEREDAVLVASARIWQAAARTDSAQLTRAESLCRAALLTSGLDESDRHRGEATLARVLLWQQRGGEAATLGFMTGPNADPFVEATAIRVLLAQGAVFEAGRRARGLLNGVDDRAEPSDRLIALGAHLRVLLASGDLTLAEECLWELRQAAQAGRCPLRLVRARLLWLHALRRAGEIPRAEGELRKLTRMRKALPPLLRAAVEQASRGVDASGPALARAEAAVPPSALELVVQVQHDEDDHLAVRHVCERLLRGTGATRVDVWTADAGPPTASIQCGFGLATQLGPRALEAGISIGPELVDAGLETAIPVRLGSRLLAAIAVRWSTDRNPPADFAGLVALACAVSAPRIESLLHHRQQAAQAATAVPELVGVSSTILDVRKAIGRAAAAPFSVLVEGESGVGKELVARAIHQMGPRRDRRFCDINCAALPDDLLESELFGHTRGAFTGAVTDRAGLVEEADGGTLFLDEVADLSLRAQAKLLRVVQQHEVRRVGETFSRKIDVRFVSAANRDLRVEAEQGRFRQDLLYRLDVIRIRIPPLRDRPEDIPVLACHFWTATAPRVGTQATLAHDVLAALSRHHWPGNVRELQNVIAALAVEAPLRGRVRAAALPPALAATRSIAIGRLIDARLLWERRFVELALARAAGNRSRAARELGLTRQGLLKVLTRVGLAADTDPR